MRISFLTVLFVFEVLFSGFIRPLMADSNSLISEPTVSVSGEKIADLFASGLRLILSPPNAFQFPQLKSNESMVSFSVNAEGALLDPLGRARIVILEATAKNGTSIKVSNFPDDFLPFAKSEFPSAFKVKGSGSINIKDPLPFDINSLKGEITLYIPSRAPEFTLKISNPYQLLGSTLDVPALKELGITTRILGREDYIKAISRPTLAHGTSPYSFGVVSEDPKKLLVAISLFQPTPRNGYGGFEGDYHRRYFFQDMPFLPDTMMQIFLSSPKAEVRVPFEFTNVTVAKATAITK